MDINLPTEIICHIARFMSTKDLTRWCLSNRSILLKITKNRVASGIVAEEVVSPFVLSFIEFKLFNCPNFRAPFFYSIHAETIICDDRVTDEVLKKSVYIHLDLFTNTKVTSNGINRSIKTLKCGLNNNISSECINTLTNLLTLDITFKKILLEPNLLKNLQNLSLTSLPNNIHEFTSLKTLCLQKKFSFEESKNIPKSVMRVICPSLPFKILDETLIAFDFQTSTANYH